MPPDTAGSAGQDHISNSAARWWHRLIERYEAWRFRRTYGRNADHSRALAAARAERDHA